MFKSPYETTVCKTHRMGQIYTDAMNLIIESATHNITDRIYLIGNDEQKISPFAHPIVLNSQRTGEPIVVADARSSSRIDRSTGQLVGSTDFTFLKRRCQLMVSAWLDDNQSDLLNLGNFQVKVYASLIAENLARRMNLSMDTQFRIQLIAAYFYLSLFKEDTASLIENEDAALRTAKRISLSIGAPITDIMDLIQAVGPLKDINDFAKALVEHSNSVRMEKFTAGILFNMLGGLWFGANRIEVAATALEHPPTFCAMLGMVIEDRGYRKSILGQHVQRIDRRGELGKSFLYNLTRLIAESDS